MNNDQNKIDIPKLVILLVIFVILGTIIGFVVGFGISSLSSRGMFSRWELISSGNIVPENILHADSNTVWVETAQGEMYFHQINCPATNTDCETWKQEIQVNRFNNTGKPPQDNEGCAARVSTRPKAPPSNSIQCVYASRVNVTKDRFTYYALTTNHEVLYWRTPTENESLSIRNIFVPMGFFAGLLVGTAVAIRKKGQYKEVLIDLIYLFTSMFLSAIIGSLVGLIAGIGILILQESAIFVSWERLDSPYKFQQIDASSFSKVIAKSFEGKTFRLNCSAEDCEWLEIQEPPNIIYDEVMSKKGPSCQLSDWSTPKDPPGKVVECVFTSWAAGEGAGVDYYVLLDDGKVWHWRQRSDAFGSLYFIFISIFAGAVLGSVVGMSIFIIRKKKNAHLSLQS
jgi:hypothetical protein